MSDIVRWDTIMEEKELLLEQKYLDTTLNILNKTVSDNEAGISVLENEFNADNAKYLASLKDMDLNTLSDETALVVEQMQRGLQQKLDELERAKLEQSVYERMIDSPYFAKIDILHEDQEQEKYYIGTHTLLDNNKFYILDWRTPIASVFYDYEVGDAAIKLEKGDEHIKLLNKRQFKIEQSKLKYFFDTNVAIEDELLKDALGQNSSATMHSIVQTIQSEQNRIIRAQDNVNLIVNGVAGSGKTAIALHRIAYLLYKNKNSLDADSVVVLSQNNAFSSYISQVLPELAERDVKKYILDQICAKSLTNIAPIECKYQQVERLIKRPKDLQEWKIKSSFEFCQALEKYCSEVVAKTFAPKSFYVMGKLIEGEKIYKMYYEKYATKSIYTRLLWISEALAEDYFYNITSTSTLRRLKQEFFSKLMTFLPRVKSVEIYLDFLKQQGLGMRLIGKAIKNEDAYAMWYIRMYIHGFGANTKIKHLVVDEMQDYSALQIKIIDMLFPCNKTMLGDVEQSVDKSSKAIFYDLSKILNDVAVVNINKSYRSTMQITDLFRYIGQIDDLHSIDRMGDEVGLISLDEDNEISQISNMVKAYDGGRVAIITKTNAEAKKLYSKLKDTIDVNLVLTNRDNLDSKTNIMSAFNSKGLEFDYVIVYNVSKDNYAVDLDYRILYIALSRAMHKLDITYIGEPASKINDYFKQLGGKKND